MATRVPSLNIVSGTGGAIDFAVDIPAGFDQVLGRDASADITLSDSAVSRRHARLFRAADGVWLEDLGSTNGTYINGDRLTVPYRLHDGDQVQLGNSLFAFHDVVEPDATEIISLPGGTPAMAAPGAGAPPVPPSPAVEAAPAAHPPPPVAPVARADLPLPSRVVEAAPAAHPPPPVAPVARAEPPLPSPVVEAAVSALPAPAAAASLTPPPPDLDAAASQAAATGVPCPNCFVTNRSEAWFCGQCGRQLRAIPYLAAAETPARVQTGADWLTTAHGDIRRQEFRQAMRARNGGRRVAYNESLAIPTVMFRVFVALLLVAAIIAGLVILIEGVHRVFGS
jgi:hypothetical protein